jgi:hypothetical protein
MSAAPVSRDRRLDSAESTVSFSLLLGVAQLAIILLGSIAALLLLDAALDLSVTARCLLQLIWLGGTCFLAWRLVFRPWQRAGDEDPPVPSRSAWTLASFAVAAWVAAAVSTAAVPNLNVRVQRIALPWYRNLVVAPYQIAVVSGTCPTVSNAASP